ncbi:hypothetical protein WBO78_24085 [Bosea sp. CCNWLW174]|uniref:PepSY domain-containing protein n=1 Tax=unclassified Bosea (in: a-proteobacteria) TaxID=2653178 RepID=UPI0030152885
MRTLIALALLACLCGIGAASAAPSGKIGQARIGEARAAAVAQERVMGEVIDVELDDAEDDEPGDEVYEVRLLTPVGDVISVRIAAIDGRYLSAEGPDLARALRGTATKRPTP